jgi:hypothetical protein
MAMTKSRMLNSNKPRDVTNGALPQAVKATCYHVDASSAALTSFHYSSTSPGGAQWRP